MFCKLNLPSNGSLSDTPTGYEFLGHSVAGEENWISAWRETKHRDRLCLVLARQTTADLNFEIQVEGWTILAEFKLASSVLGFKHFLRKNYVQIILKDSTKWNKLRRSFTLVDVSSRGCFFFCVLHNSETPTGWHPYELQWLQYASPALAYKNCTWPTERI
jgi:hypothetical protein